MNTQAAQNNNETPVVLNDIQSKPEYPFDHQGVCLIVGTAPCVYDDLKTALNKYPDADICGVNDAGELIQCDHIATVHGEKIHTLFLKKHVDKWQEIPLLHIREKSSTGEVKDVYQWPLQIGAGSGAFAAYLMAILGYKLVIMCGCPMDGGGGYTSELKTHAGNADDPRFGLVPDSHEMVLDWKRRLKSAYNTRPESARIRSMSGFTKRIFGGLENDD